MPRRAAQSTTDISLESVPGVGIVRARSLRKAGFPDLDALRNATVEQIAAIPGISAQKAQQLVDYAKNFAHTPPTSTRAPVRRRRTVGAAPTRTRRVVTTPTAKPARTRRATEPENEVAALARRVAQSASDLLRSKEASAFRRSLARQVAKVVALTDRLIASSGADDMAEKAKAQLNKIETAISRAASASKRKAQGRIAAELRARRRKTQKRIQSGKS